MPEHDNNTASVQRARLLDALRRESLTTLEARSKLDVLHPAARVMELRRRGHSIVTVWTTDLTPEGRPHRVARYILRQGEGTR
ncbi:helix-turn-helix domain-containing protein [Fundidesulfovibrio butyratiphilus]